MKRLSAGSTGGWITMTGMATDYASTAIHFRPDWMTVPCGMAACRSVRRILNAYLVLQMQCLSDIADEIGEVRRCGELETAGRISPETNGRAFMG